jgi:peptidoglycan hydrolase-like protein with peptidoglycan-binding domain
MVVRKSISLGIVVLAAASLAAATTTTTTKKKTSKKRSHPVSASAPKTTKSKPAKAGANLKSPKKRKSPRSYQQAPTPERYTEIQQALAGKGYFQGERNGKWGPDSTEALKRFQAEQNLTPDGKLNSLSLIALGLGPRRLSAESTPPPAADSPK